MKTILVTGATGFIGNYVVEALLKMGHPVIATSSHEEKARTYMWYSRVRYIPFDLSTFNPSLDYYAFFGSPEKMVHLAWEGLPNYKSDFHFTVNLPRHYGFLKNMIDGGLCDLTVTGTCLEYGMQEGELSEDRASFPSNPYALAKDSLRQYLMDLRSIIPFSLKWVRLFYMYGKGQSPNSLLSQLDKALDEGKSVFNMSGGEQVRDYLPIDKVASNIVKIALQTKVAGIINCCSGQPVTVKQLVENHLNNKKKNIFLNLGFYPYPDYEPMAFWGDNTKLKTIQ